MNLNAYLGEEILILLVIAMSIRSFLFDIKFAYTREVLRRKHELLEIFLDCSFCNGFWTGLFTYLIVYQIDLVTLPFAVLVGASSYYFQILIDYFRK